MSILHFHFVYKAKPCIYHGPYFFMSFVMQFMEHERFSKHVRSHGRAASISRVLIFRLAPSLGMVVLCSDGVCVVEHISLLMTLGKGGHCISILQNADSIVK